MGSVKTYFKPEKINDPKYRKSFQDIDCFICNFPSSVCHHIIFNNSGMGTKPSDNYCVNLCGTCHSLRHSGKMSEKRFWELHGETVEGMIIYARRLYRQWLKKHST